MTEDESTGTEADVAQADDEDESSVWWQTLLGGVGLLAFAGFLWWYFTDFENSTDTTRRMNAILAMLYNVGGKTLASGAVAACGVLVTALGVWEFAKRER